MMIGSSRSRNQHSSHLSREGVSQQQVSQCSSCFSREGVSQQIVSQVLLPFLWGWGVGAAYQALFPCWKICVKVQIILVHWRTVSPISFFFISIDLSELCSTWLISCPGASCVPWKLGAKLWSMVCMIHGARLGVTSIPMVGFTNFLQGSAVDSPENDITFPIGLWHPIESPQHQWPMVGFPRAAYQLIGWRPWYVLYAVSCHFCVAEWSSWCATMLQWFRKSKRKAGPSPSSWLISPSDFWSPARECTSYSFQFTNWEFVLYKADGLSYPGKTLPTKWWTSRWLLNPVFNQWGTLWTDLFATHVNKNSTTSPSPFLDHQMTYGDSFSLLWSWLRMIYTFTTFNIWSHQC